VAHGGCGQATDVKSADQIDFDDFLVDVEVVGRGVLAVLADGSRGPSDTRAVDRAPQGGHRPSGFDSGDHLVGVGDVAVDVGSADLLGDARTRLIVKVRHDYFDQMLGEHAGRGFSEPRCAAGDDR
jgi:hypothetical protein